MEKDPAEAFKLYAPPNLLDVFTPEQQAQFGRQIQEQQKFISANDRPRFTDVQNQIMQAAQMQQAQSNAQQQQQMLGRVFSPQGAPAGGAPQAAPQAASGAAPRPARQAPPEITQVITQAASQYGVNPQALMTIAQLESGFDPRAQNPNSSAGGLFQFIDNTATQYGLQDKFDPAQSADAAARKMRDNQAALTLSLGREPTTGELYLAHQQGATGASRLLTNPDARAIDVVGRQQVLLNGGDENMTAGQFANQWMQRAMGTGQAPREQQAAQPGQTAPTAVGGTQFDQRRSRAKAQAAPYFQARDWFAARGDMANAEKYNKLGQDILGQAPSGQIVLGSDLGLEPEMPYFVDDKGKPTPLGQAAGANAGAVNTIHNTFQTISRDNRERLTGADTALKALESTDDFAVTQGLLTWLQAIGANPRVGADGKYVTESGAGQEFVRVLNMLQGKGRLEDPQREALKTQITQAREIVANRQSGLNEVLKAQLEELKVPKNVIDQMVRSIQGSGPAAPAPAAAGAPAPAPAAGAPAPAPAAGAPAPAAPAAGPAGAPAVVTSDAEYDALPSGTVYVDPDGVTRRKP
jgi:hypothetical protein